MSTKQEAKEILKADLAAIFNPPATEGFAGPADWIGEALLERALARLKAYAVSYIDTPAEREEVVDLVLSMQRPYMLRALEAAARLGS